MLNLEGSERGTIDDFYPIIPDEPPSLVSSHANLDLVNFRVNVHECSGVVVFQGQRLTREDYDDNSPCSLVFKSDERPRFEFRKLTTRSGIYSISIMGSVQCKTLDHHECIPTWGLITCMSSMHPDEFYVALCRILGWCYEKG